MSKWEPLGELTAIDIPWGLCHQCPCPQSEPQLPPTPGDPSKLDESGPGSYEVITFALCPSYTRTGVHPPRVESLFPPVLWSSCIQALLAFKTNCSGGSSSQCQTSRLGSLMWDSELSLLWENFCNITILQFMGHAPEGYGI